MAYLFVRIGSGDRTIQMKFDGPIGQNWPGRFEARVCVGRFEAEAVCWDNPAGGRGIHALRGQLERMARRIEGTAEFRPLEKQIEFKMAMTKLGRVEVSGVLFEHAVYGTSLNFEFSIDQTYLSPIIADLKKLGV